MINNNPQHCPISSKSHNEDTENQKIRQISNEKIIHTDKENFVTGFFGKDHQKEGLITAALQYAEAGFSIIPTKNDNTPAIQLDNYKSRIMDDYMIKTYFNWKDVSGIAIICGEVSGSLKAIHIQFKNSQPVTLVQSLFDLIKEKLPDVYDKLVIAKAINDVWHIFYRCEKNDGGEKLAFNKNLIIETKGEGDYIVVPPSPGHEFIQGDLSKIPVITSVERNILFSTIRSFDQLGFSEVEEKEIAKF